MACNQRGAGPTGNLIPRRRSPAAGAPLIIGLRVPVGAKDFSLVSIGRLPIAICEPGVDTGIGRKRRVGAKKITPSAVRSLSVRHGRVAPAPMRCVRSWEIKTDQKRGLVKQARSDRVRGVVQLRRAPHFLAPWARPGTPPRAEFSDPLRVIAGQVLQR